MSINPKFMLDKSKLRNLLLKNVAYPSRTILTVAREEDMYEKFSSPD